MIRHADHLPTSTGRDCSFMGFYDYFDPRRLQVIGKAEVTYLRKV